MHLVKIQAGDDEGGGHHCDHRQKKTGVAKHLCPGPLSPGGGGGPVFQPAGTFQERHMPCAMTLEQTQ